MAQAEEELSDDDVPVKKPVRDIFCKDSKV